MSFTYKIVFDPEHDAWNWYDACGGAIKYGVDWSKDIPDDLFNKVKDKPEKVAYDIISKLLKKRYIDKKDKIDDFTEFINKRYDDNFEDACKRLENVMNRPLYRNSFTTFITTYPTGSK